MKKHITLILGLLLFTSFLRAGISDFDVLNFGAIGDGKSDNTQAFQNALNKAAEHGGIVHVPAGKFRFDGVITIPRGVALQGITIGPSTLYYDKGSLLLAYAGRDNEDSTPFITLESSSTIKGLGIVYPEQHRAELRTNRRDCSEISGHEIRYYYPVGESPT